MDGRDPIGKVKRAGSRFRYVLELDFLSIWISRFPLLSVGVSGVSLFHPQPRWKGLSRPSRPSRYSTCRDRRLCTSSAVSRIIRVFLLICACCCCCCEQKIIFSAAIRLHQASCSLCPPIVMRSAKRCNRRVAGDDDDHKRRFARFADVVRLRLNAGYTDLTMKRRHRSATEGTNLRHGIQFYDQSTAEL